MPVTLHAGRPADLRELETRDVRLEVALPGIDRVRLTIGRLDGRTVLCGVEPSSAGCGGRTDPAGTGAAGLGIALLALGRPVPVLATGTELQRRVLAALTTVPVGTVLTYGELAERAGAPGAARAAASVMATNRVPLVLPCHRIVPAGRGTGAYGWGAEVKAALLALEGAIMTRPDGAAGEGAT